MGFVLEINRNLAPKLKLIGSIFGPISELLAPKSLPHVIFPHILLHHVLLGQLLAQPDTSQPATPSQTPAAQPHSRLRVHACPLRSGANCFRKSSPHLFSFLQDSLGTYWEPHPCPRSAAEPTLPNPIPAPTSSQHAAQQAWTEPSCQ